MATITTVVMAFVLLGSAIFAAVAAYRRWDRESNVWGFPGPRLLPYIGRIHDVPPDRFWVKLKEWSDTYGGIYKTQMLGWNVIIISDESIAEDLMVKRSKIYSDRPAIQSLIDSKSEHGSLSYLPLMGKNEHWLRQRKLVHGYLREASASQYKGILSFELKRLLYLLLGDPNEFSFHIENMGAKVMATLTYDDPTISAMLRASAWGLLTQMSPNGPITNLITPLWHLPLFLNPWKRRELRRRDAQQTWWMELLLKAREQWNSGHLRSCWARQYLENEEKTKLKGDFEASSALGMLAVVGVFTVGGPVQFFLVAMLSHPEWLARCQEEVDWECHGHLPTLKDSPNLPILRACIKEIFRWRSPVPAGVAHETEADDYYRGGFIPKGTRVLPLDWAMMRNEKKYPDPENYHPERWLEPEWPTYREPLTEFPKIQGMSSFGWGIRTCLGQTITQDEMLMICGGLVWAFDLKHKTDPVTGARIEVSSLSTSELITKPMPFEMAFVPRTEKRRTEIISNWLDAKAKDAEDRQDFISLTPTP